MINLNCIFVLYNCGSWCDVKNSNDTFTNKHKIWLTFAFICLFK